jgi:ligand-binding sensor domain-containing protein/AAA+ ATPase superfamily predicted ATPase
LKKLNKDNISAMLIDKQGNIWFGTYANGLFQYDGKKLTHYTKENGFDAGFIMKIIQDRKGNMWFACNGGLVRYDGKEFKTFTQSDVLPVGYATSILEDRKGILWIIGNGIAKYDGKKFTKLTEKDGFKWKYYGRDIIEDRKGNIWFSTDEGVCRYDGKSLKQFTDKDGVGSNPFDIMADSEGNIWFAYQSGGPSIVCYDGKQFTAYTEKDGLGGKKYFSNMTDCIFEDREGNIWFGHNAGGGLTRYTPQGIKTYDVEDGLPGNNVSSISEDKNGNLWLAMDRGICKYDGKAFTQPFPDSRWSLGPVGGITPDSKGNLWLTGGKDILSRENVPQEPRGIIKYDGKSFKRWTSVDGLPTNQTGQVIEDKDGNIWITTGNSMGGGNGIIKYDGKSFINLTTVDGLSSDDTMFIEEDLQGNIWIGTWGGGVSKYDGKKFTNFKEEDGLASNSVFTIFADSKGRIWIGTFNGLSMYDGKSFTTIPQLSSRFILRIIEDRNGYLWFATNDGVFKTDGKVFAQIDTSDGLPHAAVGTLFEDRNGDIWMGTRQGIARYKPNLISPFIQVDSIKTDKVYPTTKADKNNPYFEAISLPNKTEYFRVNYRGVSLRSRPEAMQYFYQLEGYDKDWQGPIKDRSVDYINMKPGKYTFKVKAVGIDLNYSEPASMEITIAPPPFYTRAGFLVGSILTAFMIPSIIYASMLNRQKRKQVFDAISNPYIVGNPIRSGDMFFGREDDFRFVQAKLGKGETGLVIVFAGERRSGKTSILFQILNGRLGDQFVPILLDMQAMTVDNEAEFFEKIASEINSVLSERINIPTNAFRDGNPTRTFEKFIADVMTILDSKSLLFLFDEYELIETKIDDGVLRPDIITFFASLLEKHPKLSFIFTGSRHLEQRSIRYWSILIGKSIYRKISFLSELDAMRLIKEPVKGSVVYSKGIPERIYRLTSGQPFYTQVACQNIVDRLNAKQRNRVMQEDIEAVSQELAENPLPQMIYFWDGLDRNQRITLSLLGEVLGDSMRYASAKAMLGFATEHELDFGIELTDMERILDDLFTHDVLERERVGDGNYEYRFRVDLFRIWIRHSQSIWQSN